MERKTYDAGVWKSMIICGFAAVVLAALLSGIVSVFVIKETLGQGSIGVISPVISALAVFVGSLVAAKGNNDNALVTSVGTCIIYVLITILMKLAFFPGTANLMLRNILVCVGASFLAVAVSKRKKKRTSYRKRARR